MPSRDVSAANLPVVVRGSALYLDSTDRVNAVKVAASDERTPAAATKRPWFERVDPRLVVLYLIGFIGLVITFIVGWLA